MRVLHLVSRYRWTGCAEPAVNLCRYLAREGVDSRLCCVPGGSLERRARELETDLVDATYLGRDYTPWGILGSVRRLARYLHQERIDVVHAHTSHDHWFAALALRWFAPRAIPLVRTHHETRRVRTGFLWRRIFNDFTAVNITVSRDSKAFFTGNAAIRPEKVQVIYGGLDLDRFRPSSSPLDVRAAWGIPRDATILAHLSHVGPDRRQDLMLEAFTLVSEEYPDLWLVFLGEGNRSTVRRLKERVASLPFGDRVVFSLDFADRRLPWLEQLAAVSLVAVLAVGSDGSSRGVMEAMALSKPVIGARIGVIPELIEEGGTGWLVESERADRLAAAIRDVLSDPEKGGRMGIAASLAVRKTFRCERQARQTLELYRKIVDSDSTLPVA